MFGGRRRHVLEAEPQGDQAHGDANDVGADPGPAPGPGDQEAHSDPQDATRPPYSRAGGQAFRLPLPRVLAAATVCVPA